MSQVTNEPNNSPVKKKSTKRKKRSLLKQLMKTIKKPKTDLEIKQLHREQISKHLGGGTFTKLTKIS